MIFILTLYFLETKRICGKKLFISIIFIFYITIFDLLLVKQKIFLESRVLFLFFYLKNHPSFLLMKLKKFYL